MKSLLLIIVPAVLLIWLTPLNAEAETYTVDNAGNVSYTFEYPNNWKKDTEDLNRFSSIDARVVKGSNDAQMNFESGSMMDYLLILTEDGLASQAEDFFDGGTLFESGSDKYFVNNVTVPYAIVQYEVPSLFGPDLQMVGMVAVVSLNDPDEKAKGSNVVVVQYVAEEKDFDEYLPQAEKVIQSIKGVGNGTGTGTGTGTHDSFTSRGDDLSKTRALCDTVTTQSGKDLCETLLN